MERVYFFLSIIFAITITLAGCNEVVTKPPGGGGGGPGGGGGGEDPKIDWEYVSSEIVTPYCLKCHNADFSLGGVDLSSYESTEKIGIKLCDVVASGRMPPSEKIPEGLVTDLCAWVSSGFPRYSPQPPSISLRRAGL